MVNFLGLACISGGTRVKAVAKTLESNLAVRTGSKLGKKRRKGVRESAGVNRLRVGNERVLQ